MCWLVAFQWLYELALAMLKFITCLLHPLQDCQVEPRRRVKEKLKCIESKYFLETLHCPRDAPLQETKEVWTPPQKTRYQQLPPRITAYPLSLCQRLICCPVLKENAAVKCCLVLRDR